MKARHDIFKETSLDKEKCHAPSLSGHHLHDNQREVLLLLVSMFPYFFHEEASIVKHTHVETQILDEHVVTQESGRDTHSKRSSHWCQSWSPPIMSASTLSTALVNACQAHPWLSSTSSCFVCFPCVFLPSFLPSFQPTNQWDQHMREQTTRT